MLARSGVAVQQVAIALSAACAALVAANAAVLSVWLALNASDVPFGDMIQALGSVMALSDGRQGLVTHLLLPHNEHMMTTSRPLFLLDMWVGGGKGYLLVGLNLLTLTAVAAGSALVAWLATAGQPLARRLVFAALAAGLWLNAHQLMNLNWGFQIAHFLMAALGFAIAVLMAITDVTTDRATARRALLLVGVMIVLAGLTIGVGLVAGPVALTVAILLRWNWRRLAVIAFPTVAVIALYVVHVRLLDAATQAGTVRDPLALAQFIVLFMGGAFLRLTEWPSNFPFWLGFRLAGFAFGGIILAVGAAAFVIRLRQPRTGGAIVTIGLVAIGMALGAAVLGAGGRVAAGVNEAANQKYATISMLGWVGALFIVMGFLPRLQARWPRSLDLAIPATAVVLLAFVTYTQVREYAIFGKWNARLQESATAVQFRAGDAEYYNTLSFDAERLETVDAGLLRGLGKSYHSGPRPQPGERLSPLLISAGCFGGVDSITPVPSPRPGSGPAFRLQGWSWIVPERRPARWLVVLNAADEVVGLATPTRRHPIVDELVFAQISAFEPAGFFGFIAPRGTGAYRVIGLTADKRRGCAMGAFQL
jgi:hypothetical protein